MSQKKKQEIKVHTPIINPPKVKKIGEHGFTNSIVVTAKHLFSGALILAVCYVCLLVVKERALLENYQAQMGHDASLGFEEYRDQLSGFHDRDDEKITLGSQKTGSKGKRGSGKRRKKSISQRKIQGPRLIMRSDSPETISGETVSATLLSGASNGFVKARLSSSLMVRGRQLLEAGSLLIGRARNSAERVEVQFTKAIPRGEDREIKISAVALDGRDRVNGIRATSVASKLWKHSKRGSLNFLSGMAEGLQEYRGEEGTVIRDNSLPNAALSGLSKAGSEETKSFIDSYNKEKRVYAVKAGTKFVLMFLKFGGER